MGNSVLLCLLLTVHIRITRARTYLKMVHYTKIILSLLVILNTAQALPVSQKPDEIEVIAGSRPKRQSDLEASPMAEHLEAPKSTEDGYFGPYEVFRLPSINGPFEQEDDFSIPVL